jgi:cobalamin biosynthesis Mg chelatase CobN
MKNYIYLTFALVLACKSTSTTTQSERTDFDIIHAPEFSFMQTGSSLDLGGITLTKLEGNMAAVTRPEKTIQQESTGTPKKTVDRSRTEVNINSGNKDKSRVTENSNNKTTDKSRGDLDKSRVKVKVPGIPFLYILFVFVLLAMGVIWFFYPRIKKHFKPPFF